MIQDRMEKLRKAVNFLRPYISGHCYEAAILIEEVLAGEWIEVERLPERKRCDEHMPTDDCDCYGWNACLDEIQERSKGNEH